MSISQDSAATFVCREVFDETSQASTEEVIDYAKRLGIDPDAEPHLLELARKGLMAALPKGWVPCFHEASGAWYYYQAATGTTTWEHPLDAVYKDLVQKARASGSRQPSVEEDSKTTAKELESHEEATLPKEPPLKSTALPTKIPTKLTPLKKSNGTRKKEAKSSVNDKADSSVSLSTDRASRDYTNLKFQDPKFYECPRLLDSGASNLTKLEINLKEVLKRSESLSPRHEKDWEQLSSKFNSEENIIDIDKLSASALARSERPDRFDKEKHPSQLGPQKELTLSGGGSMFLKRNRSRDNTPSQEAGKFDDFRVNATEEVVNASGDRPKSILREKLTEDDDRPLDEERKSVRFDLADCGDVLLIYPDAEDETDSESSNPGDIEQHGTSDAGVKTILERRSKKTSWEFQDDNSWQQDENEELAEPSFEGTKIKRFLVQNVSENDHLSQIAKSPISIDNEDDEPINTFEKVKKIDIASKSDTSSSLARSTESDQVHQSKFVLEKIGKKTQNRWQNGSGTNISTGAVDDTGKSQENEIYDAKMETSKSLDDLKASIISHHEREIITLKMELETKLEQTKRTMEKNYTEQKLFLERTMEEKLLALRQEMAEKEEQEIQKLINEMDEAKEENLKKVKIELETELDKRKRELTDLRSREINKLVNEYEQNLAEEKVMKLNEFELNKQHVERVAELKRELDKEFDELRTEMRIQQREKLAKITEDHEKSLADALRDFRIDERVARMKYKQQLEELRANLTRELEKDSRKLNSRSQQQDSVDFEKLRCEKRLLQDKYTALKEKYLKLKNDVRFAVERRSKRKETHNTISETEKSVSTRTRSERTESSDVNTPPRNSRSGSINANLPKDQNDSDLTEAQTEPECSESQKTATGLPKSDTASGFSAGRFESDDTTTASETNANIMKKRKSFTKRTASVSKSVGSVSNNNNVENPVENIRKQLEKLDEIGDQLPSNETAYRLRYPFQDKAPVNASSELEFFRHRIHVERDSVRRAREALRQQRSAFQGRQRAWKQRSARTTLEQLVQEERELSEMEISLHRTRSLLGEKVIHLRHLEQSLNRVAKSKKSEPDATAITTNDELTLSDMSSASSGFSSTDLGTDTIADVPDHYQESTEIIASLENLNTEIREIWGVLNQRQDSNYTPAPSLMQSYLRWLRYHHLTAQPSTAQATFGTPNIQSNILSQLTAGQPPTTTTQNIIAQYGPNSGFTTSIGTVERGGTNLMERTRNLRDWLRQARVETTDLISPGQATL